MLETSPHSSSSPTVTIAALGIERLPGVLKVAYPSSSNFSFPAPVDTKTLVDVEAPDCRGAPRVAARGGPEFGDTYG